MIRPDTAKVPMVSISGTEIRKIEYRGQQVVTFAMIDKVHGRPKDTAKRSFNENSPRFIEGEDFYRITQPDEIRTLGFTRPQGGTAASVIVITKRGYLKIAKTLGDDKAWEVFNEMLEVYFAALDGAMNASALPLPKKLKTVGDVMHGFSRLAGLLGLKGNQRALSAAMATRRETGVDVLQLTGITHLEAEVQDQFITPTQIALRVDPTSTPQKINTALEALGYQIERRRIRKGADRHDYWELTDAGKAAGGEYFDTTKKRSDGTPVKQIRWPVSAVEKVQHHLAGDRS